MERERGGGSAGACYEGRRRAGNGRRLALEIVACSELVERPVEAVENVERTGDDTFALWGGDLDPTNVTFRSSVAVNPGILGRIGTGIASPPTAFARSSSKVSRAARRRCRTRCRSPGSRTRRRSAPRCTSSTRALAAPTRRATASSSADGASRTWTATPTRRRRGRWATPGCRGRRSGVAPMVASSLRSSSRRGRKEST